MNQKTVNISCVVNGGLSLTNSDAQALLGVTNSGTWAKIRGAIGLPERIEKNDFVMFGESDIRWAWVCQRWIKCNVRKGEMQTTYGTFKVLKRSNDINWFLEAIAHIGTPANITEINSLIQDKKSCLTLNPKVSTLANSATQRRKPSKKHRKISLFPNKKTQVRPMKIVQLVVP